MAEIASAFVSLLPSARGFGRRMESEVGPEVDGAGKKVGGVFKKAFLAAGAIGGAALVGGFVKDAISQASDLNESASKVGVVFGKQAGQVMKASKTSAAAMGLSKQAYLEATGTLGNLLVSLDIAPKKSAALSQQMVKLAGDLASFNNVSPEDALLALKSGLTGETEPLKRFGVNMNEATLKAKAMAEGLVQPVKDASKIKAGLIKVTLGQSAYNEAVKKHGKNSMEALRAQASLGSAQSALQKATDGTIPPLNAQQKALAAQALIMEQTKTAQGDFARTSSGLANQQRILAAQFTDLKARIGTAFLPIAIKLITWANDLFKRVGPLAAKLKGVGATLKTSFSAGIGMVQRVWKAFDGGNATISQVRAVVSGLGAIFKQTFGGSGGVSSAAASLKGFASTIASNIVPTAAKLGAVFRDKILPAVLPVASAIATNLAPVLKTAANTFKTVVLPAVVGFVSYVSSSLLPIVTALGSIFVTKVLPGIKAVALFFYGTLYPAVVAIATSVAQSLKPVFDQLVSTIKSSVLPTLTKILDRFRQWWPTIKQVAMVILGLVGWLLKMAAAILGKVLPPLIKFVGVMISRFIPSFLDAIEWIAKAIGFVIKFGAAVVNAVKFAVKFQVGVLKAVVKVVEFFATLPLKVLGALGDLGKTLYNAGRKLIGGLISGIKSKVKDVAGAVKSVAGKIKGFFPGSPVREGPLKSWNRGGAGTRLVGMLADGLGNTAPVDSAVRGLASRVQVAAPSLEPSVSGATFGGSGGREIRGTLSLDRQGVATIHGVAHDAVASGHKQRDATARNAAMGSESFK